MWGACVVVRNLSFNSARTLHISVHWVKSVVVHWWRKASISSRVTSSLIIEHGETRHFAILHGKQVGNVLQRVALLAIVQGIRITLANPAIMVLLIAVEAFRVVRLRVLAIAHVLVRISVAIVLGHEVLLLVHGVTEPVPLFSAHHVVLGLRCDVVKHIRKVAFVVHIEI